MPNYLSKLTPDHTLLPLSSGRSTQLATSTNTTMLQLASQKVTHENCRALLAHTAMENTLMLSVLEANCSRIAPSGQKRYQQIADAYAFGAATKIVRY